MEIVARPHARNLVEWAASKPEVLVLSADLTGSCEADVFRNTYPGRFVSCGIAEQNMMSVAGGLCREGFTPFVHTFAVFICRRAFDQVAMSVAYPNLPVRMFGFLPGITTPGGATHQAIDDVALMRTLPNMTVIEVGDATEVESVLDLVMSIDGPVYVRMLRGEVPRIFPAGQPMELDRPRVLSRGGDVTVVSSGICTAEVLRAGAVLAGRGLSMTHIHVSTLKPFSGEVLDQLVPCSAGGIITVENHLTDGGLGTVVAEWCASRGIDRPFIKLGIQDTWSHGASRQFLMRHHGFDALSVVSAIEKMTGRSFRVTDADLDKAVVEAVHSDAKPEAL